MVVVGLAKDAGLSGTVGTELVIVAVVVAAGVGTDAAGVDRAAAVPALSQGFGGETI